MLEMMRSKVNKKCSDIAKAVAKHFLARYSFSVPFAR